MDEQTFKAFEQKAGVAFRDRALLTTAFTHRSYVNESDTKATHNERLEFLGDAVVEIVVTHHLFTAYPHATEGDLTAYRAALVNATMLGAIAEGLGMNECLLLSRGEAKDTGRARATILANTFEAVVGALYLDQGFAVADDFIVRHVLPHADEVVRTGSFKDAKSRFQEIAQARDGQTPRYETVAAEGPDHDKEFVVELKVGDRLIATGEGKSKQEAEQDAAEKALRA
jgi:ribonuclease-3